MHQNEVLLSVSKEQEDQKGNKSISKEKEEKTTTGERAKNEDGKEKYYLYRLKTLFNSG